MTKIKDIIAYLENIAPPPYQEDYDNAITKFDELQINFPRSDLNEEGQFFLGQTYREKGDYALAYLFAQKAISTPRPEDILFLDDSVYDWRSLDELAIASFYTGQYDESAEACHRLLNSALLPQSQHARVIDNLNFALRALGRPEYRESG